MAKVTFGPIISEARGSIGSTTFSRNRYSAYTRNRTAPSQTPTAPRVNQKAIYTTVSNSWATLSDLQRAGWRSLADRLPRTSVLGKVYFLTGQQLFQRCNALLASISAAPISDPPANLETADCGPLTIAPAGTLPQSITLNTAVPVAAPQVLQIWASTPLNNGRTFYTNLLRLLTFQPAAGPWDIGAAYSSRFGIPVTQKRVGFRVRLINSTTGVPGPWRREASILLPSPVHFAGNEAPTGAIDSANQTFTLANPPSPALSLALYWNGVFQWEGHDYTLAANVISTVFTPQTGDTLVAFYRY